MPNILLADNHEVVRKGIQLVLESDPDCHVVGDAGNGTQTLEQAKKLKPDVVVLDLNAPDIGGFDLIQRLKSILPHVKIVILSAYSHEVYVMEALRSGAEAYVLKQSSPAELVVAIHKAAKGRHFLCDALAERAFTSYAHNVGEAGDPIERLTGRERQVLLMMIGNALTCAQIGERLFISPRTVEAHRARIMKKLALKSHEALVRFAIMRGMLPNKQDEKLSQAGEPVSIS